MVFTKLLLQNTLAIRPYNYVAASEPLVWTTSETMPSNTNMELHDTPTLKLAEIKAISPMIF